MSAFIVSDNHVNALINWAAKAEARFSTGSLIRSDLDGAGQILIDENYRSINHRYKGEDKPHKFAFVHKPNNYTPVQILKSCDCYDYQACETDDYYTTAASKIIESIRHYAIGCLPGYDSADWGL